MIGDAIGDERDNVATLLSLGVIAYVGETLMHEGIGHGGACMLVGGRIAVLAPLWMRCSRRICSCSGKLHYQLSVDAVLLLNRSAKAS